MRSLNPAYVEAFLDMINRSPFYRLLSMRVMSLEAGASRVEIQAGERHLNPYGGLHGGVHAALIDTAAFWAAYGELDAEAGLITIDLKVDDLATTASPLLVAEGRRIKNGRTLCLAEAAVRDGDGRLIAHGTSKLLVTQGLQTVDQACRAMDVPPLPPKFLSH